MTPKDTTCADADAPPARGFSDAAAAATAGRTLGLLYVAGATIGLASMLLPHSATANDAALYSNTALAYVAGGALLAFGNRVRGWMVHLFLGAGVVMIARAIYYSGEEVSFYSIWFTWIGLLAFYFMTRRVAVAYVVFTSAVYAMTLLNEPGTTPIARWLTTVATLVVAGVLISALLARARREAELARVHAARMRGVADMAHKLAAIYDPAIARAALCEAAAWLTGATEVELIEEPGEGPAAQAFATGRPVDQGDRVWRPVMRDDRVFAVLSLRWEAEEDRGDADGLMDLLAVEAGVTLERLELLRRLELSARTDGLTGLPNRRGWDEALERKLAQARAQGLPLAVAMLDIDHFKRFNDEHGHLAGDLLLKEASAAWRSCLRDGDLLARYGGEEFALAFRARDADEARGLVERMRAAMPSRQTCSAGIAVWDGIEGGSAVLHRADQALYRAKRLGRDRAERAVLSAGRPS